MPEARLVPVAEIRKHESAESCWIVVNGNVWDLTEYAPEHPGGGGSKTSARICSNKAYP